MDFAIWSFKFPIQLAIESQCSKLLKAHFIYSPIQCADHLHNISLDVKFSQLSEKWKKAKDNLMESLNSPPKDF